MLLVLLSGTEQNKSNPFKYLETINKYLVSIYCVLGTTLDTGMQTQRMKKTLLVMSLLHQIAGSYQALQVRSDVFQNYYSLMHPPSYT